MAWDGNPATSQVHIGEPGNDLWLNVGQGQIAFSIAMGTGKNEDLAAARAALKRAEDVAISLMESNRPEDEGVLASMWKSFSIWDSKPADGGPTASEHKQKLWLYFSSLVAQAELALNFVSLCFKERQWVSIGLTARRSYKFCEEAETILKRLKADGAPFILDTADREEEIDVLSRFEFVVGLFHFCVSLVPPGLLTLVEAIGFQADRELGIRELKSAVSRNGIHFITASLVLVAYHNFFMQEAEPAEEIFKSIFSIGYEHSPAIRLMAGTCSRRVGNIPRAIECYQQGILGAQTQPQVVLILEAELGNTYFMDGAWDKAALLFEKFITNTTNR